MVSPNPMIFGNDTLVNSYTDFYLVKYDSLINDDAFISRIINFKSYSTISNSTIGLCDGDSALVFGVYRTASGTYYDSLTTTKGCDSLAIVTLILNSTFSSSTADQSICLGDSILLFGIYRKTADTYYDSLSSINGCDSIVSTILTIDSLPIVDFTGLDSTYCIDDVVFTVTLIGSPSGGTYSGPGITADLFDPFATGYGTFTISYSYTDGNGCLDSTSQTVSVTNCTGVRRLRPGTDLDIYPNPNTGRFRIEIKSKSEQGFHLSIINSSGQEIYKDQLEHFGGNYKKQLDLREYPVGTYTIQLTTENEAIIKQVIIE